MNYRSYKSPGESGAPSPEYTPGKDRQWIVIAYSGTKHKSLGVYSAESRDVAIGLAKKRHGRTTGTFRAELVRGKSNHDTAAADGSSTAVIGVPPAIDPQNAVKVSIVAVARKGGK